MEVELFQCRRRSLQSAERGLPQCFCSDLDRLESFRFKFHVMHEI